MKTYKSMTLALATLLHLTGCVSAGVPQSNYSIQYSFEQTDKAGELALRCIKSTKDKCNFKIESANNIVSDYEVAVGQITTVRMDNLNRFLCASDYDRGYIFVPYQCAQTLTANTTRQIRLIKKN